MATNEEILRSAIIGLPRVAERLVKLSGEQREKALEAVELSYLQSAIDSDYDADNARHLVGAVMDTLRAEVADQARDAGAIDRDRDGFASLERIMKLLVTPGSAAG